MSDITKANRLTDETLNSLKTVEDAIKALGVSSTDDLNWDSSAYTLLADKSLLVGKKFLAVQWKFHDSAEYAGNQFVSVYVITADTINGETQFIFNDGSTGVCAQLSALTAKREAENHPNPFGGALIKGGLKLSEYDRVDANGKSLGKGKTYYLSN